MILSKEWNNFTFNGNFKSFVHASIKPFWFWKAFLALVLVERKVFLCDFKFEQNFRHFLYRLISIISFFGQFRTTDSKNYQSTPALFAPRQNMFVMRNLFELWDFNFEEI